MASPSEIIDFWFEGITDESTIDKNKRPFNKWFMKNQKFDEEIRNRFEKDLIKAQAGEYKKWSVSSPQRLLALILLFDQFSRNIYRNSPQAFAFDELALTLAQESLLDGFDRQLFLIQRTFIYLPLEHAEDIASQKESVYQFGQLVEECERKNPKNTHYFQYNLFYARKHLEIIEQFGRFPHRNTILNRPSTPQELKFLSQQSSAF